MKYLLLPLLFILFTEASLAGPQCREVFKSISFLKNSDSIYLPKLTSSWRKSDGTLYDAYRSNAPFLWSQLKQLKLDSSASQIKSLDLGDAHDKNFDFTLVKPGKTVLMLNDFDDIGSGVSFLVGAAKRAAGNLLTDYAATPKQLWDAYLQGLNGKDYPIPSYIQKGLLLKASDFAQQKEEFFKQILTADQKRFSKDAELILRNSSNQFQDREIQNLHLKLDSQFQIYLQKRFGTSSIEILDVGFKAKKNGGSQGFARFWYLVKTQNQIEVIEFKYHPGSSLKFYNPEMSFNESLKEVRKSIPVDQLVFPLDYVSTDLGTFWARVKRPDPIIMENPELMSLNKSTRMIGQQDISLYLMWFYGQWQSTLAEASTYKIKITENSKLAFEDFQKTALATRDLVIQQHQQENLKATVVTNQSFTTKKSSDESIGLSSFNQSLEALGAFFERHKDLSLEDLVYKTTQSDLRKQFFYLESLARVYERAQPQFFKQLRIDFKLIEDRLGHVVLKRDLRKNAEKMNAEDLAAKFRSQEKEALNDLEEALRQVGWLSRPQELVQEIKSRLSNVNELKDFQKDKEFLLSEITKESENLRNEIKDLAFDKKDIEKGFHELRRRLRWIIIQIQNLNNYTTLTKESRLDPRTQQLVERILKNQPDLLQDKSVQLPKAMIDSPIQIPWQTYALITYYVKYIGDLKDRAETYIYLSEQLKDPDISPRRKEEIKKMLKSQFDPKDIDHRKLSVEVQKAIQDGRLLKEFVRQLEQMNQITP